MPALTWMSMLRLALCATLLGLASGCNRAQYREQADREATQLVAEKSYDPRWSLGPCFDIEIDPRSRFYNAYDRTHPPMPPDDPDSHRYMHCIDGKRGWKYWHEHGDICDLESPWWREALGDYTQQTEDGKLLLRLEDSVRLARIHSPAYQTQLETIYLSALDVSSERFRFDTQFFGGSGATYRHLGALRPLGESNTLTIDNDLLLERRFATAADLLVTFANSAVWEFNGDDSNFTTSVLGFAFVQPLLRRGGRVIALEQLTIAERTLLANLRAFQRYRHGFYTNVAIGQLGVTGPQRRGGFFGGTGLTGFTGQGSGGFGGVGDVTGFGRVGFGVGGAAGAAGAGFAGGGAGTVGGFIGLLQQLQQIRNTRNSLNLQLRTLALLEANLDAGLIDIAQVDQFRQNIQTERANLLQAENNLENSLDTFKRTTLGLPPGLRLAPDDGMIRQFQLIDPATSDVQDALAGYLSEFGDLPEQPPDEALTSAFNRIGELVTLVSELFPIVADDLKQMEGVSEERMQGMSEPEQELIESIHANLSETFDEVQQRQDKTAETLENLRAGLNPQTLEATADGVVELLTDLETIVGELSLVQARSRLEMISVDPVYLTPEHALEIARCSRLDWANNRAALVDTWRLIEFNANALQSNLTVRLDGDVRTVGDNPTDFRGKNGLFRASVRFDPPLTRLLERNSFRQQLIQYEQDRRQLIQFEDGIHQTLRQTLRGLNQLRTNLEYQRQAVAIAIRRVDETREVLSATGSIAAGIRPDRGTEPALRPV